MTAEETIRAAIEDHGPITFAEFMELALYGPSGYYLSGSPISASGDYFTSPAAHPLFGALIALQVHQMWDLLGRPADFTVVESGAGNGTLAADITGVNSELDPEFRNSMNYVAVDVAPAGRQHLPVRPLNETPRGVSGCLLSNELLDAMPVHRFEVRAGDVKEVFIGLEGDALVEVISEPSDLQIAARVGPYLNKLPEGYRGEVNLGLEAWAQRQSEILEKGWLLTFDYGFDRHELYKPERTPGSLRTYSQHTLGQDPLLKPGKQDITSHVDFTAVDEALVASGFELTGRTKQADFLMRLGLGEAVISLGSIGLSTPDLRANEAGISALADPAGMGGFIAAAYSRNTGDLKLAGFHSGIAGKDSQLKKIPLLRPDRHIRMTGGQTNAHFEVESLEDLFSDQP